MDTPANKPFLELDAVPDLVRQLFPVSSVSQCSTLVSYDDLNFVVEATLENEPQQQTRKFVLKVLNRRDSLHVPLVEGMNSMMAFLHDQGLPCPVSLRGRNGDQVILHGLPHPNYKAEPGSSDLPMYAVRLLSYLPGTVLNSLPRQLEIYFKVGKFLGVLSRHLENFPPNPAIQTRDFTWALTHVLDCKSRVSVIKETEEKKQLVLDVLNAYEKKVVPTFQSLPRTYIHGDLNDYNILLEKVDGDDYEISGLLDYGDVVYSYRVCDIAIAMAYACIGKEDLFSLPGSILAGYQSSFPLSDAEFDLLYYLMIARMAQSATMGSYAYAQNPDEYLLVHAAPAWKTMARLWEIPKHEVEEKWKAYFR